MQEQIFVGREPELQELNSYLQQALSGQGQICFVTGQAGTGKTALVGHFVQQALAAHPDLVMAGGSCNAQAGIGDPYLPFREALSMLTGDASATEPRQISSENTQRLRLVLVRSVQVLVEVAPELVGVFVPGAKLVGALGKAVAKKTGWMDELDKRAAKPPATGAAVAEGRVVEQYTAFVERLSAETPLILFLDDLQWADGASINLLFHLARHVGRSRVLILGAYRPNDVALGRYGRRHPLEPVVNELTRYHGDVSIDLGSIPDEGGCQFVAALLDSESNWLGQAFRQALYHRTEGHALFTVELIRAMRERGDLMRNADGCWVEGPSLDWSLLPARVEGVIEERLDRLDGDLREMLAVASVEGEEFTAEVVARVQAMAELEALRQLSGMLADRHGLVRSQGIVDLDGVRLSRYRFVHTLFQQYLYDNLAEAERVYLHQDIGEALETLFEERVEGIVAQLAHHFEEARLPGKAATYRLQAGNRAHRMSAYQEAIVHLNQGLAQLPALPAGPEQTQLELALQTSLANVLVVAQGYASPHVQRAFGRARELSRALGDPPLAIPALYGLAVYRFVRAELQEAYEEAQGVLQSARQAPIEEDGYVLGCQLVLGAAALHRGQLARARQHLEAVINSYDLSRHRDLAYQLGHDPAVGAWSYLSFVLWQQGCLQEAIAASDAALELARDLDHTYSQGYAASFAAMLRQMLRQAPQCLAQAETALQLGREGRFPLWQAIGGIAHGWALARQGRPDEGIVELAQGLATREASGAALALPYQRALLAEAFLAAGARDKGLQAVEGSFCCPQEVWWLPEQHRLRAELLQLAPGNEVEAETSLRQGLALAGQHQAHSLELRAATSLARLLVRQGRAAEGRELLSRSYASFREGLEMPDLQEAGQLLDSLQQAGKMVAATATGQ